MTGPKVTIKERPGPDGVVKVEVQIAVPGRKPVRFFVNWVPDKRGCRLLIWTKRDKAKHVHRQRSSFAINAQVAEQLVQSRGIDVIRVRIGDGQDGQDWEAYADQALIPRFKSRSGGYEPQYFIPESLFTKGFRSREWPRATAAQGDLFAQAAAAPPAPAEAPQGPAGPPPPGGPPPAPQEGGTA